MKTNRRSLIQSIVGIVGSMTTLPSIVHGVTTKEPIDTLDHRFQVGDKVRHLHLVEMRGVIKELVWFDPETEDRSSVKKPGYFPWCEIIWERGYLHSPSTGELEHEEMRDGFECDQSLLKSNREIDHCVDSMILIELHDLNKEWWNDFVKIIESDPTRGLNQ